MIALKLLRITTAITVGVACCVLVWHVASALAGGGIIEIGGLFEQMVIYPTLIALPCIPIAAVAGAVTRGNLSGAERWMWAGQLLSIALPPAAVFAAFALTPSPSGWEGLIAFPALVLAQLVCAVGLFKLVRRSRARS